MSQLFFWLLLFVFSPSGWCYSFSLETLQAAANLLQVAVDQQGLVREAERPLICRLSSQEALKLAPMLQGQIDEKIADKVAQFIYSPKSLEVMLAQIPHCEAKCLCGLWVSIEDALLSSETGSPLAKTYAATFALARAKAAKATSSDLWRCVKKSRGLCNGVLRRLKVQEP